MVPKKLCLYWEGPVHDYVNEAVHRWRQHYPGYDIHFFDAGSARDYLAGIDFSHPELTGADILDWLDRSRLPSMRADIFRVAFCYQEGGIWCDIGIRPVAQHPVILEQEKQVFWRRKSGAIPNGLFAVPPQAEVLAHCLNEIKTQMHRRAINNVYVATGPKGFNDFLNTAVDDPDIVIFDEKELFFGYFDRVQRPIHREQGRHWSRVQQVSSIYRTYFGCSHRLIIQAPGVQPAKESTVPPEVEASLVRFAGSCPSVPWVFRKGKFLFQLPSFIEARSAIDDWLQTIEVPSEQVVPLDSYLPHLANAVAARYFIRGIRDILRDHDQELKIGAEGKSFLQSAKDLTTWASVNGPAIPEAQKAEEVLTWTQDKVALTQALCVLEYEMGVVESGAVLLQ